MFLVVAGILVTAPALIASEPSKGQTIKFLLNEMQSARDYNDSKYSTGAYKQSFIGTKFTSVYEGRDDTIFTEVDLTKIGEVEMGFRKQGAAGLQCGAQKNSEHYYTRLVCSANKKCIIKNYKKGKNYILQSYGMVFCPDAKGQKFQGRIAKAFVHLINLSGGNAKLYDPEAIGSAFD